MISVRIRKRFAPFLLDVEFRADRAVTVLFGASGAGKTLTLDCIAGFQRPDEGRILIGDSLWFDGASGLSLPPRRRGCGYVFQNYALFPHMTLRENLEFAVEKLPRLERHRRVNDLIERFHLTEAAGRHPAQVSGGQRQRCSIARALIGAPRVLLLDEPARGLDAPLRAGLYDVIRQVRAEFDTPVVLVTHDLEECFALGEEMVVLRGGRVVQTGPPGDVLDRPASLDVARLFGVHSLLPAEIVHLDPQRNTSTLHVNGHDLAGLYYPGHLKGDRVTVCLRPDRLSLRAPNGSRSSSQLPAKVLRRIERPDRIRLEFAGGLAVDAPRPAPAASEEQEWWVEVPPEAIHLLPRPLTSAGGPDADL